MLTLRDYQVMQNDRVRAAFAAGARSVVSSMPTGAGKTATAAAAIARAVELGSRVIFATHLDTIVTDTSERLAKYGVRAGIVQADRPTDPTAPVQVCSLATLHRRGERPHADFVIVDECQRAAAPSIRTVLQAYPGAFLLGLSASPCRGDDAPLGSVFQELVVGPSVRELVRDRHLVPTDVVGPERPTEALVSEPVDAYERWAAGSRALFFCASVEHAEWVTCGLLARGIPAVTVTGETKREAREDARRRFAAGEIKCLVSINVFVEGWDCPETETIVLARDFSHVGSFLQACGRGMRLSPHTGKTRCLVLDLRGASAVVGLPDEDRVWSLQGRPKRTEKLVSLRRCVVCAAIFRSASRCPRCGADVAPDARPLPRVLRREEKVALLSHLPQADRDRRYYFSLVRVATVRMRKSPAAARIWAKASFVKKFGREPEVTA